MPGLGQNESTPADELTEPVELASHDGSPQPETTQ
jgi:hypothetical protein